MGGAGAGAPTDIHLSEPKFSEKTVTGTPAFGDWTVPALKKLDLAPPHSGRHTAPGHREEALCFQSHLTCPSQPGNCAERLPEETVECSRVVRRPTLSFQKSSRSDVLLAPGDSLCQRR